VIFATFMAAMILGAMLFNAVVEERPVEEKYIPKEGLGPNVFLAGAILLAGATLLTAVFVSSETGSLLAFLVFEVCNGFYVPSVAFQRGKIVNESNRAGLYGLMKLPLFIFVIIALCTAVDGKLSPRFCFLQTLD
jgi:MFS transporter, MFS domain-containing protein family, molybdate-anion transporter